LFTIQHWGNRSLIYPFLTITPEGGKANKDFDLRLKAAFNKGKLSLRTLFLKNAAL
jgi:hypothetical protein